MGTSLKGEGRRQKAGDETLTTIWERKGRKDGGVKKDLRNVGYTHLKKILQSGVVKWGLCRKEFAIKREGPHSCTC